MDPVTHGAIGLAISAFSSQPVSLDNPVSLGCAIGAMSPDLDFIIRIFKNDHEYLKHHRGISHTVPFIAMYSIIIAFILNLVFTSSSFVNILIWTFIGGLSHTVFDILNSYGAKLFKKKYKLKLLSLYDPILTLIILFLVIYRDHDAITLGSSVLIFIIYLMGRKLLMFKAKHDLQDIYSVYDIKNVCILPSLKFFYKLDFIINSKCSDLVGEYNVFSKNITIKKNYKNKAQDLSKWFLATKVGQEFSDFSYNFHLQQKRTVDKIIIRAIDLRYHFKGDFMHHATVVYDHNMNFITSYSHPYTIDKKIELAKV